MKPTFKMYVKPNCPYCTKARDLIVDYLGLRVEVHDVTDRNTLRNELIEETGITTVPIARTRRPPAGSVFRESSRTDAPSGK